MAASQMRFWTLFPMKVMADIRKEQECEEFHRAIWTIADVEYFARCVPYEEIDKIITEIEVG